MEYGKHCYMHRFSVKGTVLSTHHGHKFHTVSLVKNKKVEILRMKNGKLWTLTPNFTFET